MAPPAKLSAREVGREALLSYRANAGLLLFTALVVFAPITLLETATHDLGELAPDDASISSVVEAALAALAVTATAVMGEVFYTGVVVGVVEHRRTAMRRDLAEIAGSLPYLRLAAVDLTFVAMVAFGLVLFVVPGLLAFGWFALAAPVVEIEGRGVRDAFRRSRQLVRGSFWRVLAILAPAVVAGDLLGQLLVSSGPWVVGEGFLGDWLGELLAQGLTAPIFALAAVVTTHHLIAGSPSARRRTRSSRRRHRGTPL